MPQDHRRKSTEDYDAINPDFPPPSLKAPQNDGGKDVEKPKKKEKKWSIGGLFRRKKKVSDTDSSSPVEDEEEKKGFLERRRAARKRRNRGSKDVTGSFEHVIINPPRSQNVETMSPEQIRSKEIAIDRLVGRSHESLAKRQEVGQIRGSSVSLETAGRKGGRIQVKARVEASRERLKADSSSDEGGGSSRHSSSSVQRSKNDENLGSKDGSLSRRSRAARTERYKKRLSRDDESFRDFQASPPSRISRSDERLSNKKAEKVQANNRWTAKVVYYESSDYDTKYTAKTKSATPSPIGSPKVRPKNALHYTTSAPASSNYVTFPPSHVRDGVVGSHQELRSQNYPQVLAENVQKPNQRYTDITPPRLPKSSSDMISKSPFPYSVPKQYPAWGKDVLNRKSASYDCNVNHLHYVNNQISQPHPTDENVLVVQFPISRPTQKTDTKVAKMGATSSIHHHKQPNPPPPPPRDPHRRLVPSNGYIHETSPRPMSYAFEDRNQHHTRYSGFPEFGSSVSAFQRVPQTTPIDIQLNPAINKHHRSSSDHQIPSRINSVKNSPPSKRRSSAQPTDIISRQYSTNTESLAISPPSDVIPQTGVPHHYQYYTDQQPRSRKPIHISYQNQKPQQSNESYLSDSQVVLKPPLQQNARVRPPSVQNAADFWKQKDQESSKKIHLSEGSPKLIQRHFVNVNTPIERSRSNSPHNESHTITSKLKLPPLKMPVRGTESSGFINNQSSPRDIPSPRTPTNRKLVHNEIGIPVFDNSDANSISKREYRPLSMLEEKQEMSEQEVSPMKEKLNNPPTPPTRRDSKVNAVTSFEHFDIFSDDNEGKDGGRRQSSNLEEALNELEAIYKSLRLGEEGYLEKVAKEKAVYENNRLDPSNWNAWVQSRGFESDSSFNYSRSSLESVDSIDSPLRRTNTRRSGVPDRVTDDMAYRRLNKKDRPPPQEQEVISQAGSFLLVSPTLSPPPFIEPPPVPPVKNEPDITLDDVVYRNIKHVQNSLKVLDPQPPFGIPLGPITPAPTSDYLHVTPKETYRPTFKPRKTPDVISDDLAFRNLRKDNNKEALFTPEDTTLIDSPTLKKKRAVRSLSANLLSIIQKESKLLNNNNKLLHNNNTNVQNDLEKSQSFTDVTDPNNTNYLSSKNSLEEKKFLDLNVKKNLSGDDSDTTPRVSRHFMFGTSSPMIATSSETLTGSKNSLVTPDSRPPSQKISQNSSPRLSLTPERRHTTDGIHVLPRSSLSPAKHVPLKNEFFKINNSTNTPKPKQMDFRRSPTPDSHTFTYQSDKKEKGPPVIYDQTESDLLAILAREAKEASEQLSKELNELNFDKKPKNVCDQTCSNINLTRNDDEQQTCPSKENTTQHTVLKPLAIGKIIPHKPVKLNTFCITEDNKLENKQTIVTEKHPEIEGSKSMTDLLKELTRTLDFDFGTSPKENENQAETKPELPEERAEKVLTPDETIEQEVFTEAIENRPDKKETEEIYFSSVEEIPCQHLSPAESSLLSSLRETTTEAEMEVHTVSPVNSFPLDLSDGNEQDILKAQSPEAQSSHRQKLNESCDISKIQPNDDQGDFERRGDRDSSDGKAPGGCSMDCSSLADEEAVGETCLESAMVAQLQPAQLSDWMDPAEAARQQRIARYKEERRRQLDAQYGRLQDSASSSSSGGGVTIRSTRASRLRSAAVAAVPDGGKTAVTPRRELGSEKKDVNGRLGPPTPSPEVAKEKSPLTLSDTSSSPGPRKERDKSAKRKSNLNRSLNAEPVKDSPEDVVRRRRSVGTSPGQSPAKSPRATPATNSATATESDTPRPVSSRTYKRITPPRESPRLRPRSNSGVLERQSSSSPPTSETVPAPAPAPAVNGVSSPPAPEEPPEVLPETPSLPDVVVLPSRPSSILKKKSLDETSSTSPPAAVFGRPVSILKRKTSQEEGSTTTSQPVTFSPSVVEPTARRQGILKKHCSLDEGSGGVGVLARRSASPDKPILKQQRRSSLEDLRRRTHSPEPQSILKRKTSRDEAMEASVTSEPQGILKRKTSSSTGPVHVTIAESVILAVAGEDSLADDHVRPILKKKTSLCEEPPGLSQDAGQGTEAPRPILKKKSSSETEDGEEKPMKPILKSRRDSGRVSEGRNSFTDHETQEGRADERPLQNGIESRDESLSAFSARAESSSPERSVVVRRLGKSYDADSLPKRRSFDSWVRFKDDQGQESHSRTSLSVAERVMNMESFLASEVQRPRSLSPTQIKGALPRRRDKERCRTQPITIQELSNSRSWSKEEWAAQAAERSPRMEQEEPHALTRSDSVSARASLFEAHLKQIEDEAKSKRVLRGSAARRVKLDPSRFQTQPVTQGEVEEAKRVSASEATKPSSEGEDDPNDPSKLSLAERVQLFNRKMVSERGVLRSARYKTQPVTPDELEKAQRLTPISRTASSVLVSGILKNLTEKNEGPKSKVKVSSESEDENMSEPPSPQKRGILKSPSQGWRVSNSEVDESLSGNLKSVLKKENKKGAEPERKSKDLHSILKVSRDKESSSSEETETESEDDKPNANSDLIDLLHKVEAQARGERKISTSPERKKATLVMSNNKKAEEPDKLMNLKNLDQGKENYDVTRRIRRKRADGAELSEGDSSSSGGREVRKIIGNEAIARRRQAGLAREAAERVKKVTAEGALSKSRSHSAMNGDVVVRPPSGAEPSPLRRCRTQPMDECDEPVTNGVSIAQRLQALQKSGQTDWKKRISRLNPEEELPTTISINAAAEVLKERLTAAPRSPPDAPLSTTPLDERLGLLESSTQGWRRRVNPSDATQFSVAGRMAAVPPSPLPSPAAERKKKIPKPERFRSKGTASKDAQSMPTSPEVETTSGVFKRSISAPGDDDKISLSSAEGDSVSGPLVSVPKAFDDDFSSFFASSATDERIELKDEDLETVTSSTSQLLVQRRRVKIQRRHGASSNPVKALAARTDLRTEYVEVKSGVAHREEKRLRVEKLAKNSSMAVEALAGLASQEDFAAVQLRKAAESTAHLSPMLPYKELMLLQIKGRRHVQTRLVQPHYSSINQGDSYVLVTPSQVFHWVGEFSNVIERSRGAEIAQHIAQTRDMGCTATQVTTLQGNTPHKQFWQLLGADEDTADNYTGAAAGHPDEDELYELALTGTNMIYEVEGEELVPRMDCWGSVPRIEILDHNKVIVLDFGSELYIWMGKTVTLERRRTALRLGQELWGQGYDYSECDVCPLTQAKSLGTRTEEQSVEKSATKRPEWALLAKVTQHMETVLLREKFLDWPDFSRVIQVKTREKDKQVEGSVEVKACDAQPMVDWSPPEPDLQLEGSHLGRGTKYYDPETHRHFEVSTLSVTVWHVQEFDSTELDSASLGQLYSGDSYVIRWCYSVTVTGRELTGAPSRHSTVGRDRCCYWTWQGGEASTNDKGAAALLTVQLDQERGPQLRLAQGQEPPAFRQLFHGGLIVHRGRRSDSNTRPGRWRLYMALGEEAGEAMLIEVTCSMRQLRSRACLVLLDTEDGQAYLWRGAQALPHTHAVAFSAVEKLKERLPAEAGLEDFEEIDIEEISEGEEPKVFFEALGGHNRQLYVSLSKSEVPATHTPRLFRLTSVSGVFQATPVTPVCHHFPSLVSPFPYTQQDLYSARQPALFLLDAGDTLWLWQGWWADERERSEDEEVVSGTGVGEVRWQAERRAAMRTTLEYCSLHQNKTPPSAHLVWAGLEPLHFTNLFPTWTDRDDIAEINIRDGHKPGEVLPVQAELERLTVSVYPPAQLLQRPLPEGVDPTRLEEYLAPNHFKEVLGLSQEEFSELPAWKQNKLKQEKGLF